MHMQYTLRQRGSAAGTVLPDNHLPARFACIGNVCGEAK